jgi:glucose-6-phosphate 1-dehydrogenase
MINTLVVFGATGDLTGRLLLPAVAALYAAGDLDSTFQFIGAAHQSWTEDEFKTHARRRLEQHAPMIAARDLDGLFAGMRYRRADVTDPASVTDVLGLAGAVAGTGAQSKYGQAGIAVYLALPTQLQLSAAQALRACQLPTGSRIAVEKPFGRDAQSAAELNLVLADVAAGTSPDAIFRVDHALAMTVMQRVAQLRESCDTKGIAWGGRGIESVEIRWEETLALEGRASFYDQAGALRDVMQNHQLQIMCAIALPSATDHDADRLSDLRAEVLRAVRLLSEDDIITMTRRARYTAGRLAGDADGGGRLVPDYIDEEGVDPTRATETFAEVVLQLDSAQWAGTRFVLRAGKALRRRRRGVLFRFRATATDTIADLRARESWIDVDEPANSPGSPDSPEEAGAYVRVVSDLLAGGSAFSVGSAEAELAWQVFTPVLDAWARDVVPLSNYPAGSAGP